MVSINNKASIFTAEAMAMTDAIEVAITNKNKNISIFSDSLSVLTALNYPTNNSNINPFILKIRQKYIEFLHKNSTSTIHIYWIPAHRGIHGNECADIQAKISTEKTPEILQIPYSDIKSFLTKQIIASNDKLLCNLEKSKRFQYFKLFHKNSSLTWFKDKKLDRNLIVTVCRC